MKTYTGKPYRGSFECHVTVAPTDRLTAFSEAVGEAVGWKPLVIQLDGGEHPTQPMANRAIKGEARDAVRTCLIMRNWLTFHGFEVVRTKVEAHPHNEGVPVLASDLLNNPEDNYFESHVKVRIPAAVVEEAVRDLGGLVAKYGARISRNARISTPDYQDRFVTLRQYNLGRVAAMAVADQLSDAIERLVPSVQLVDERHEYAIYDDNVGLDSGWIDRGCADCPGCPMVKG